MALASSPLVYPPSSSPNYDLLPTKRKRLHDDLYPLKRHLPDHGAVLSQPLSSSLPLGQNTTSRKGPFLDEEDDSDTDYTSPITNNGSRNTADRGNLDRLGTDDLDASTSPVIPTIASIAARTSKDSVVKVIRRARDKAVSCGSQVATDSTTKSKCVLTSFYGVQIHNLIEGASTKVLDSAAQVTVTPSIQGVSIDQGGPRNTEIPSRSHEMWTEKYRARKFTELVGDDRTHRDVLRWMKTWDPIVFPGAESTRRQSARHTELNEDEKPPSKVLLLAGGPGLGKTTLAHVCARQAGYEVLEINASDDRSSSVVKGRIKDCLGTENVKAVHGPSKHGRKARPVCVIVDEVDGVVGGASANGEGGFMKALIDLITLDQKNSRVLAPVSTNVGRSRRRSGIFRLSRPLILVCNDLYAPSLRPLRNSTLAEIVHVKSPPLERIVSRLQAIFSQEDLPCDSDAVRTLCEATWGVASKERNRLQASSGGDLRGCLVAGEWIASKLRTSSRQKPRLTKAWMEEHVIKALSHGSADARGVARGGTREIAERVFLHNAGFGSNNIEICDQASRETGEIDAPARQSTVCRLREMIDLTGESDRVMGDCFSTYAEKTFQDDTFLTKPNAGCEWLNFYDRLSTRIHHEHDWELGPYLAQPILGFHVLFASSQHNSAGRKLFEKEEDVKPYSGFKASLEASETTKQNLAGLQNLQSRLSVPLAQCFRSVESIVTELNPYLISLLTPNIKPVVVGGGGEAAGVVSVRKEAERRMLQRSVAVMHDIGLKLERIRIEASQNGQRNFVYRMEPPVDTLASFSTNESAVPMKYSVCQAMDQEHQKYTLRKTAESREARYNAGDRSKSHVLENMPGSDSRNSSDQDRASVLPRRDFFGRCLNEETGSSNEEQTIAGKFSTRDKGVGSGSGKVWVSFNEGFSNAVRKPITLEELLTELER